MGCKKVITFTGMKFDGMDRDKAIKDCLDTWKQVLPLAEQKGITLVLGAPELARRHAPDEGPSRLLRR